MAQQSNKHHFMRHKNIIMMVVGIIFAILFQTQPVFHPVMLLFGTLGFVGAIIAGMLFVSTFTVASGAVLLALLLPQLGVVQLTLFAGLGALIGDLIIFKFVRGGLISDVLPLYKKIGGSHFNKILHTKMFSWTLPIIGAFIIMSPLPDELGVSLMGLSKISTFKFVLISVFLNSLGILFFISFVLLARSVM
jgi:hypothetical protein